MTTARKEEIAKSIDQTVTLDSFSSIVHINQLNVENPTLFQNLQKIETGHERIAEVKKVIDLGSFVKSKVEMVMDTDYIDSQVKEMTQQFGADMKQTKDGILTLVKDNFDPNISTSYSQKLNEIFKIGQDQFLRTISESMLELKTGKEQIAKKIDDSLNPDIKTSYLAIMGETVNKFKSDLAALFDDSRNDSFSYQLKTLLTKNLSDDGAFIKAVEAKLSFDNPDSTINQLQNNLTAKLDAISKEIELIKNADEIKKEANKNSSQKGYDFEDALENKLDEFASKHGDIVENLTKIAGEVTSSKKGDFIYTVKRLNKVIVIEAKNRNDLATPVSLMKIMDTTKLNRKADYIIYIVADESQLHKQINLLQEYDNNKIITHFGLFQVALNVAISRLQIENNELDGIDKSAVEQEINTITTSIKSFQSIKTAATNIRKEADKISSKADEIKADISNSLSSLNNLLFSESL